ncbi:MAG: hypothetical protein WA485_07105 [Candidatus Sulfotelmatobacter sp.]
MHQRRLITLANYDFSSTTGNAIAMKTRAMLVIVPPTKWESVSRRHDVTLLTKTRPVVTRM